MSTSTAQVLMKKAKRGAAAYIHADCVSGSPQHLGPLLDVLLNPSKAIDEWETIDWCRWLLAGGRTPDEFASVVRSYDKHDKCGLVWIPRVVAYRCRTCGISPCMSICRECFHRGDHSTHDFNMFLSQAGGACDCGDNSVMKEDGFCSNHGNKCPRPGTAPAELMCVAEAMMPRLILRLLQHLRENSGVVSSDNYRVAVQECEGYVQMLMEFNNMGDLMRSAMTKALINPQMYRQLVEGPFPETEYGRYMGESTRMYRRALDAFPAPQPPDEYRHLPALSPSLQHNTLLDEFIFWTFKYEFPQNVVCLLLNMLPDQDYKEQLTRTFVLHYARIPLVLESAADPDTLSNRVVHMSVQLFSNEALALRCVQQLHLLHVMVLSLRLMMAKILEASTLHGGAGGAGAAGGGLHYVIDCTKRVMKEHCYWPLVSDFNNVLSHRSVALLFLQDDELLDMWFHFLSMLQGMNVNVRETGGHIEFEPSSYYAAFSCELEAAAYPMWSVLAHLTAPEHAPLARRVVRVALRHLRAWLPAAPPAPRPSEAAHASFHFPLHRYLAAFLCAAVRSMAVRAAELLPAPRQLAAHAAHPLRVQSFFYEILSGVWVRNGLQIKGQAMTYIQANFCNSMVDMDIYWLQICAAHLPPDLFIDMCIDTFGVREWLSMTPMTASQDAEQDAMVEGLLTFLAILVSSRTNLGNDEVSQSRLEVATLLAGGDKTHSQLLELIPEQSGNAHTRNFETVLKELSVYRAPPKGSESLEQGLFVPKPIVWEQYYDPLHVLRRAVHRHDFHASMDRFSAYVAEKRKAEGGNSKSSADGNGTGNGTLWPPLRPAVAPPGVEFSGDPRQICSSGVLQGALLAVLHRGVRRRDAGGGGVPDHVLALAVHLLAVAAALQPAPARDSLARPAPPAAGGTRRVAGVPLLRAFSGSALCDNARTLVAHVPPAYCAHAMHAQPYHSDSETEWEPPEGESADGEGGAAGNSSKPCIMSTSTALAIPPSLQMFRSGGGPAEEEPDEGAEGEMRALESGEIDASTALAVPGGAGGLALALTGVEGGLALALPAPPDIQELDIDTSPSVDYDIDPVQWTPRALPAPPAPLAAAPPPHSSADTQVGAAQVELARQRCDQQQQVPVNESLISLLLKLHSALSGRLDSFSLEEPAPDLDAHIGDGPHFVGRVLHALAALDARCADAIQHVRTTLWPHQRERQAEQRARERREKEERSRRARERQAAVMREFARRQQQFLSAVRQLEGEQGERMECEGEEEWEQWRARDYDCVICNTTARANVHDPVGLVALLQSSSVLGHRRRAGGGPGALALSEPERARLAAHRAATAAAHHYRLHDDLHQHFDQESWVLSVSVGWEGGVAAQSCGHHVHLRCLRAYLRSLSAPRPPSLLVERCEFLCPLCRQLANSVLPLAPPPAPHPPCPPRPHLHLAADVRDMLDREHHPPTPSQLSEAMGKAMTDMTSMAGGKVKQRYGSSPAAIFTFVTSLVRTNLECELVQRGNSLVARPPPRYKPRDDCIVPLMSVAGVHARALVAAGAALGVGSTWRALVPALPEGGAGGAAGAAVPVPAGCARPVPLLLRDPTALLLHVLLLAPEHPPHIDIQHFTCIVRALYALTYYQVVNQLCARGAFTLALQRGGTDVAGSAEGEEGGLLDAARLLLTALAGDHLLDDDTAPVDQNDTFDIDKLELEVQELILPYLRISSLIRKHVYGGELPLVTDAQDEFPALLAFLQLGGGLVDALPPGAPQAAAAWARQLARASAGGQLAVHRVISSLHAAWAGPALLRLPREYDRLFTYYHERVCLQCGAVPKEASVCLLCGTLVCLKQPCCRHHQVAEAVQHATECGGGTGIFLVVTSTYIIVIRGRRACLWGSLYLDDYDEEDRDLKRGKPLYLSEDRVELLQAQWLAHRFDHTKRTWVWHRDSL